MTMFEFTVTLDRAPTDEDYDRIFESGLDDTTPGVEDGRGILMVSRDSGTVSEAIVSVVRDAERAGFAVVAINADDLVTLNTIAKRVGRTYEGMRLIAQGKRGGGGFPAPLSGDGWSLYSWTQSSEWLRAHLGIEIPASSDARTYAAADMILRARALVDAPTLSTLDGLLTITGPRGDAA